MLTTIDPTAIVGHGNDFGPGVVIGPNVTIGSNNSFGPYASILGNVSIGHGNHFSAHVSVGGVSRHRLHTHAAKSPPSECPRIVIGSGNVILEHAVIHQPLGVLTEVGDGNSFGAHIHVGHDVVVENNCVFAPSIAIGGFARIGAFANLGIGVAVHNRVVIGSYAMVGMNAAVTSHVRPGVIVAGMPATFRKPNLLGFERNALSREQIEQFCAWIKAGIIPSDDHLRRIVLAWQKHVSESNRAREPL